jgi:hypothetical protein
MAPVWLLRAAVPRGVAGSPSDIVGSRRLAPNQRGQARGRPVWADRRRITDRDATPPAAMWASRHSFKVLAIASPNFSIG